MADQAMGEADERDAHEYGRPLSIEDASNRLFIHPLSDVIVKIGIKLGLNPNAVSLAGLGLGVLAAFLYYELPEPAYVLAAFAAMLGWHIFDGADGKLARATGKTSAFGRILDGAVDHLVFSAVYIGLAIHIVDSGAPLAIWWLVVGAGLSHAVQAAGYEERRQKYQRRLDGIRRDAVEEERLTVDGKKSALAVVYDHAQKFVAGGDHGLDEKLEKLRTSKDGIQQATILVARTVPMVRAWGLLNANNRTFLIFLFALLDQPLMYFAFEFFILNFVLVILMVIETRMEKNLVCQASKGAVP